MHYANVVHFGYRNKKREHQLPLILSGKVSQTVSQNVSHFLSQKHGVLRSHLGHVLGQYAFFIPFLPDL